MNPQGRVLKTCCDEVGNREPGFLLVDEIEPGAWARDNLITPRPRRLAGCIRLFDRDSSVFCLPGTRRQAGCGMEPDVENKKGHAASPQPGPGHSKPRLKKRSNETAKRLCRAT